MYAIVETGGKQYQMEEGKYLKVELLDGAALTGAIAEKGFQQLGTAGHVVLRQPRNDVALGFFQPLAEALDIHQRRTQVVRCRVDHAFHFFILARQLGEHGRVLASLGRQFFGARLGLAALFRRGDRKSVV